jgi:hypothetical protein
VDTQPHHQIGKWLLTECLKSLCAHDKAIDRRGMAMALYASVPGQHLPDSLTATLEVVYRKAGTSGDVFCDTALAWLNAGADHVLTYEQVVSTAPVP